MNFDDFNHSELVAIAKFNDIRGISRATPREFIIEAIHVLEDVDIFSSLEINKNDMSRWLQTFWADKFDLQKPPGRPCPSCISCTDLQITACYAENKGDIELWKMKTLI